VARKLRHAVERGALDWQGMGLLVGDHLQPVFEHAQPVVALAHDHRIAIGDDPGLGQGIERGARAAQAQRRVAPAVDQLVGLGEEFDLADAAAPALEIVARPHDLPGGIVVADARGQSPDLGNRPEIEAAPPDKRADRVEKGLPRATSPEAARARI
jgi:hypothetical protein